MGWWKVHPCHGPTRGLCPCQGLIAVPVFLSSSPDLSQLPTPHVHSTPAPSPGPSQPISHASTATASSSTPAPIQGTVRSISVSLWTRCSSAGDDVRRTVAPCWVRDTLPRAQPGSEPRLVAWGQRDPPRASIPLHHRCRANSSGAPTSVHLSHASILLVFPRCFFHLLFVQMSPLSVPMALRPHYAPGDGDSRAIMQRWCSQRAELCPSQGSPHHNPPSPHTASPRLRSSPPSASSAPH